MISKTASTAIMRSNVFAAMRCNRFMESSGYRAPDKNAE